MTSDEVFKLLDVLVKAAIPVAIYYATRKIARAQYFNTAQTGWNEFNKLALGSKENLVIILRYMYPPEFVGNDIELGRKAYLGFIYLNAANSYFVGLQNALIDAGHGEAQFSDLLGPFLLDEHFYKMSQGRGYHPEFRKACTDARDRAQKAKEFDNKA